MRNFVSSSIKFVKRPTAATLRRYGFTLPRSADCSTPPDDALFRSFAPESANQKFTIALVGTLTEGLNGFGKVSQLLYFPKFGYALAKLGISLIAYRSPDDALRSIDSHDPAHTAFILVYNEVFQRDLLPRFDDLVSNHKFRFYNAPAIGEIIGNKPATNAYFVRSGIPVPPIEENIATSKVFSNAPIGTHATTVTVDIGQPLDKNRYNTRFINTAYEFKGKSYYVALRTLAVTGTMIAAYVRLRPTGQAEASVHAGDTPNDRDLISHFYAALVEANRSRLVQLCEQIGKALGRGFYAHDILPCRESGKLYVCETGFKFDDQDYREALWRMSSDLPFLSDHFTVSLADLAAETIAKQCFGQKQRRESQVD